MNDRVDARGADRVTPRWPPPALERSQGDLFVLASRAALAGVLLVLPLLLLATREPGFATLGPLADAWWLTIALATIGLAFALDAVAVGARMLRRAGRAIEHGHDPATVLRVLADTKRDMGFLLAGARHFSIIETRARETIARIRVTAAVLLAFGGLWLPFALSGGLFLASRRMLSPDGLLLVALLPSTLAYLVGGVAYLTEERRVRRARRTWHDRSWSDDLTGEEVRSWRREVSETAGAIAPGPSPEAGLARGRLLDVAGVTLAALAVVIALPVLILVPASAVGPVLTTVSAPGFETYRPRAARAEAYRSYRIEADPSVSAEEAGRILHVLTFVASDDEPSTGERAPDRRIEEPWIPEGDDPLGLTPLAWGDSLLERVASGVTPEQEAYLASVASHPLAADFSRLARAPTIDVAAGRWETPFPPGMSMATLPVPRFSSLRAAANGRIGAAAHALAEGREDDAQRLLSEVIAVGFLLGDDGPTLIDNLVGYAIVEAGGAAMADLFRATGQAGASAELSRLRRVADRAAAMMRVEVPQGTDAWVRSLPGMVLDSTIVRGLRWDYLINLATMAPCLNMSQMVFGAGEPYDAFMDEARASLVRHPSEEPLFELARRGWVGDGDPGPPGVFGRIAGIWMSSGEGSCVRMLRLQAPSF